MKSSMIDSCTKNLKKLSEQEKNLIKKLEDVRARMAEENNKRNEAIAQKIASTIPDLTEDALDKILDEYRKRTDSETETKPEETPAKEEEEKSPAENGQETATTEGAATKTETAPKTGEGSDAKAQEEKVSIGDGAENKDQASENAKMRMKAAAQREAMKEHGIQASYSKPGDANPSVTADHKDDQEEEVQPFMLQKNPFE